MNLNFMSFRYVLENVMLPHVILVHKNYSMVKFYLTNKLKYTVK